MAFSSPESHRILYDVSKRMQMRRHIVGLLSIFVLSSLAVFSILALAPTSHHGSPPTHFPTSLDDLKEMAAFLKDYKDEHYFYTMLMFSSAYLYKQTFAIPGSFFLNLLAGALFGTWIGLLLVSPLTALGASLCFILSGFYGTPIVKKYFSNRVRKLGRKVEQNSHRLFYFLLCARIFPLTPHWLINMASPSLNVPLKTFAPSVLLGVTPYNLLCLRAGGILSEVKSMSDVLDVKTMLELFGIALFIGILGVMAKEKKTDDVIDEQTQTSSVVDGPTTSATSTTERTTHSSPNILHVD